VQIEGIILAIGAVKAIPTVADTERTRQARRGRRAGRPAASSLARHEPTSRPGRDQRRLARLARGRKPGAMRREPEGRSVTVQTSRRRVLAG
jgi:hypothetical protein